MTDWGGRRLAKSREGRRKRGGTKTGKERSEGWEGERREEGKRDRGSACRSPSRRL